jgi:hypothetical protein
MEVYRKAGDDNVEDGIAKGGGVLGMCALENGLKQATVTLVVVRLDECR